MMFLEEYQTEPCFWDPKHPGHRNRNKVADAWERLHTSLKFPCTLNELKKKTFIDGIIQDATEQEKEICQIRHGYRGAIQTYLVCLS
nr:unnamed protein product [Callosobruchus analis]